MEYVKLGRTGMDVSKVCLGCMSFGDPKQLLYSWVLKEEDSRKIIKKSLDLGINFFDTSNNYSLGENERILGRALKDFANRDEIVLATKFSERIGDGPNKEGTSRKFIMQEVNHSLERLQTDYIDLLYIHRFHPETPIEETMSALNDLVRQGKVHALGASSMWAWQFNKAQNVAEKNGWTKFSVMQGHYNLLYREEEREMNPLCRDQGVALVPYSPLASGRLAMPWNQTTQRFKVDKFVEMKYNSQDQCAQAIVGRVEEVAKKHNAKMSQIAMAWLYEKGTIPIVGATEESHLTEAVDAMKIKLSPEEIKHLEELYIPHPIVGHV